METMAERGIQAARHSTVCIWDRSKDEDGCRGHGLLLPSSDGTVVLTCHHVVASVRGENLCIRVPRDGGGLSNMLPACYDSRRSNPGKDTAVLRVDHMVEVRPLLHRLSLDSYDGTLRATVLTHLSPDNFDAEIRAGTKLNLKATSSQDWPVPTDRYELRAFRLSRTTDARPGVSGGVVICEGGVLGLVHFAREEGTTHTREGYLVPLETWTDGWSCLEELVEPFVDANLRGVAEVKNTRDLQMGTDLVIAQYRDDVYLERGLEEQANAALSQNSAVMIVGKPKSGKTRLVWEMLHECPETLVVIPHANALPPPEFEASGWEDRHILVLFDDLHRTAGNAQPLLWQRRLAQTTSSSCHLICTTRDGGNWVLVKDKQETLLELLDNSGVVYASRTQELGVERGEDLSLEQGQDLASGLGMDEHEFMDRFDGTPGSLLLNLGGMGSRYESLRREYIGGISASRLLDSAKLLHAGGQTNLSAQKLRSVAETLRGEAVLATETWEALQRRTQEEGFGGFDAGGGFQIYRPYLEQCVTYEPSREELGALMPFLERLEDVYGLLQLAAAYGYDLRDGPSALECLDTALQLRADLPEAWFGKAVQLSDLQRDEEAILAYDEALRLRFDWPEVWVNKGMVLNRLHRHEEAQEVFEQAISIDHTLPEAWLGKGVSLASIEHHLQAVDAYQSAIDRRLEYPPAWHNKGVELVALERYEEALQAYEVATHLRPDYGLAWYSKGNVLSELGRYEEALRTYERARTEGYNLDHEAWLGKGNALAKLGEYQEAVEAYDMAIEHNPHYYEAWHQKGISLDVSGRHEEALESFTQPWTLRQSRLRLSTAEVWSYTNLDDKKRH